MTCIVAVAKNGNVWMGADSAGVGGLSLRMRNDPKIYRVGKFLFGFTSSFRMGQLLGYKFNPPEQVSMSVEQYMATVFIDELRKTLKDGGFSKTDNGVESGGTFLVGYRGRIFKVYDDFQVAEAIEPYDACGCGEDIAFGALFASRDMSPGDRVHLALEAAERFSAGVRSPFICRELLAVSSEGEE